ncbi:glycoside hydrolase family 13 protein [Domibacillus robiginosus]|uniref:glycoside hydrolase family 13 protein n=1 Tax=Domibacillus robiginosus TaxID=1071054 RepID=UPI00067B3F1E|nr:alpha-glucosidase [Domibacillus robiginosus]
MANEWWKTAVIYHIYPRSFQDSNADGIGDLQGIISRLDYVKKLGADAIWLSPVYKSPNVDYGYDVSDHRAISEDYGTMTDMEELIFEANRHGLKIILDIVYNHTSDQHRWFLDAKGSKNSPYRDFYHWRPGTPGGPPSDWKSTYHTSAWEFDEATGEYYLHMNSRRQVDLNWENPAVIHEVKEMMIYWIRKGVSGFRIDQLGHIDKKKSLPSYEQYVDKEADPHVEIIKDEGAHPYVRHLNEAIFSKYGMMTVGESGSATPEEALLYTDPDRKEVNMVFSFEHLQVEEAGSEASVKIDLVELKTIMEKWQKTLEKKGWNTLFWSNHDEPRIVTRFGDDGEYRAASAKMLAATLHMMKGTPYIYQGEEIGMTNTEFESIDEFRDSKAITEFHQRHYEQDENKEKVLADISKSSRDQARTPMQWNAEENAGFTDGEPWIKVNDNYLSVNVEQALDDPESIFWFYHALIDIRKTQPVVTDGTFQLIERDHPAVFAYTRKGEEQTLLVISHFGKEPVSFEVEREHLPDLFGRLLLSNYPIEDDPSVLTEPIELQPYETRIYLFEKQA